MAHTAERESLNTMKVTNYRVLISADMHARTHARTHFEKKKIDFFENFENLKNREEPLKSHIKITLKFLNQNFCFLFLFTYSCYLPQELFEIL